MTVYYLDIVNGSDAANGLSWANAKRSPASLCSAYALTGADEVRFAKDCTPYDFSTTASYSRSTMGRYVTMGESVEMYDFLNEFITGAATVYNSATKGTFTAGNANFTGVATAGSTISTCQFTLPASPVVNTKYFVCAPAGWATTPIDLSAYQEIWGFIQVAGTLPTAPNSKKWRLCLCSDTTGTTIVDDLEIEYMGVVSTTQVTNSWMRFRAIKSGGANLGSAIQSVALYSGTSTVWTGSTTHTFAGALYGCKTNGKLKIGDFLWFDKTNQTHTLLVHSAVIGGTTSAPKIYQMQSTNYPVGQDFSGAAVKRIRPRYRFESETAWGATQSDITANYPYGTGTDYIKWSGGWNTSTSVRDGYTTLGNYDIIDQNTKCLIGATTGFANNFYWYAEGFIIGSNCGLFGVKGDSIEGYFKYYDCVGLGTNCVFIERTDITATRASARVVDANEIWSTFPIPDVGGTAAKGSRLFYSTVNAATNKYLDVYNITIRNSCVSAGALHTYQYTGWNGSYSVLSLTDVTLVGDTAGDGTTNDAWFDIDFTRVIFADAVVTVYTRDISTIGMSMTMDDLTFWHNGKLDYIEPGGTTYNRPRVIPTLSNWAFYGAQTFATVCTITVPDKDRKTLNSLIVQQSNLTLHLAGNLEITNLDLSSGSVLRLAELQGELTGPASTAENVVVKGGTYNATVNVNFATSTDRYIGTFENVDFIFGDSITVFLNGYYTFVDCTFATATGAPSVQKIVSVGSSASWRSVTRFENCVFNGIGFAPYSTAPMEGRLFFDWCEFQNLSSTNYDIRLRSSSTTTAWLDELVANNCLFANGGVYYGDTNNSWYQFRGRATIRNKNRTVGLHEMLYAGGLLYTQTSVRHTASGYAWLLTLPQSEYNASQIGGPRTTRWPLGRIAVKDGSAIRISVWARAVTTGSLTMVVPKKQISATQAEMTATTTTTGAWEELTIDYTPDASGILEVYMKGILFGGDTIVVNASYQGAGYWDDFSVSSI